MKKRIRTDEEQAIVNGVEWALDYGMYRDLTPEDIALYEQIIATTEHKPPFHEKEEENKYGRKEDT